MAQGKLIRIYASNLIVTLKRYPVPIRRGIVFVFMQKYGYIPEPYFSKAMELAEIR